MFERMTEEQLREIFDLYLRALLKISMNTIYMLFVIIIYELLPN